MYGLSIIRKLIKSHKYLSVLKTESKLNKKRLNGKFLLFVLSLASLISNIIIVVMCLSLVVRVIQSSKIDDSVPEDIPFIFKDISCFD